MDDASETTDGQPLDCTIFQAFDPNRYCSGDWGPRIVFENEVLATDADTEAAVLQLAGLLADVDGVFEIGVGIDSRGTFAVNLRITQARAEALVAALEGHGVPRERMVPFGFGETIPIAVHQTGCDVDNRVEVRRLDGPCAR